jgi:hypothetical protein
MQLYWLRHGSSRRVIHLLWAKKMQTYHLHYILSIFDLSLKAGVIR